MTTHSRLEIRIQAALKRRFYAAVEKHGVISSGRGHRIGVRAVTATLVEIIEKWVEKVEAKS